MPRAVQRRGAGMARPLRQGGSVMNQVGIFGYTLGTLSSR